jgi:predicted transcriptional regulator
LNEKKQRTKAEAGAATESDKLHAHRRKFQNSVKHCALKNIILRLIDKLQRSAGGGAKRYFYRPIATLKTKHKLK